MFIRDQDKRTDIEIILDDLVDLSFEVNDVESIKNDLIIAIKETKEKLYWYEVILAGLDKIKKKKNEQE